MRYHPIRFCDALPRSWPNLIDVAELRNKDDYILAMERDALREPSLQRLHDTVENLRMRGEIIDATALDLDKLSNHPPMLLNEGKPHSPEVHFIHLGAHAFPSAYSISGIEGVYTRIVPTVGDSIEVHATFVISPEFAPLGVDVQPLFIDPFLSFLETARVIHVRGIIERHCIKIGPLLPDEEISEWIPYLGKPFVAALNALALAMRNEQIVVGASIHDLKQVKQTAPGNAQLELKRNGGWLLKFIGTMPESILSPGNGTIEVGHHLLPAREVRKDVTAFILRAAAANHPGGALHYAKMAMNVLDISMKTGSAAEINMEECENMEKQISDLIEENEEKLLVRILEEDR